MVKEVEVNEKKFKVRELLAVELDDINWEDKPNAIKKQVMLSTGLSEEEYKNLTVKERVRIIQAINEINGFDFPNPAK
jgi:uncharacterized protein YbaP (TraB family)